MWLGAGATIAYTFIGGFLAVSWTDTVQATLMIFALILTPIMVLIVVGGFDDVAVSIAKVATEKGKDYSEYSGLFCRYDFPRYCFDRCLGFGVFWPAAYSCPLYGGGKCAVFESARRIGMTWMILCLGGAIAVGYFGIAYFWREAGRDWRIGRQGRADFYWPFDAAF